VKFECPEQISEEQHPALLAYAQQQDEVVGAGNEGAAQEHPQDDEAHGQPQDDDGQGDREEAGPPQDTGQQDHEGNGG